MKRKFWLRKFLIFRMFRTLPLSEQEHVMEVLPKKNRQEKIKSLSTRFKAAANADNPFQAVKDLNLTQEDRDLLAEAGIT